MTNLSKVDMLPQFNSSWRKISWCLCLSAIGFSSCGKAPPPAANQPSEGNQPAEKTNDAVATIPPSLAGGEVPESATTGLISTQQPGSIATTSEANAQPPATSAVFTPTEAQLARWKQPEFEPVQLYARHAPDNISFVSQAASTSNGAWLAVGGEKLTVWKVLAESPEATLWDLAASPDSKLIKSLAIDPSGSWLAAGDATGNLRLWNLSDQKEIISKRIYNTAIAQIAIADDGKEIATAGYGKEVCIWDPLTLEQKMKFEVETSGLSRIMYAGPSRLAVAGQSLTIWDTATGKLNKGLLEKGYAASMARSADLSKFAYASDDRLQILKSADLSDAGELKGKFARNEILSFTPDDKYLWSANGTNIRCWDLATGKALQFIDVSKPEVVSLDWLDKASLLRVVTTDGVIRYWGRDAAGQAAGLKLVHAPLEIPELGDIPATAAQLQSILDLRALPQPPNSDPVAGELTMVQFEAGNSLDDTKSFYRHIFHERGWKESAGNAQTPNYLTFVKKGYRVFISLTESSTEGTSVSMTSLGNVDARSLPKLDLAGSKTIFEDWSSAMFEVKSDLLTIETELLKELSAAGWVPFARLNASRNEEPDSRSLEFIRNAVTLRVSVQRKQAEPGKYHVQYSTFVASGHLPIPKDCDYIECDASRPPALVAKSSLSLKDCQAFYDQEMTSQGWLQARASQSEKDDLRWLTYFRNQEEVSIRLTQAEQSGTWIVAGEYAEKNSWQLAKKEKAGDQDKPAKPAKPGIEAADMPIFKQQEATAVTYDDRQKRIEIKLPKNSHVEIVDFYAAKLGELGWKEQPNGIRDEQYAFVTFSKDKVNIEVRVNTNSLGTKIGISDDGLLWNKAPSQASALISYEGWLRSNKHPATLRLLDEYLKAMKPQ